MNDRANILLVDDLPANRLALQAILEDVGHDLVEAASGEEALRRLAEDDFAVVLLDVQMPGLDGYETAKLMRSREQTRHTPIIFMTAYDDNRLTVEEAYTLGAVDYLVKPLVPAILRAKVAGFVELFKKTQQIKHQAEQLRQLERREFAQRLSEENARLQTLNVELREAEESLKEVDRRKNVFLATLAHELRNPLAPILNAVQVLRLKRAADPDFQWGHALIERQVKQLGRLVDDLLDVSRISQGKINLQTEPLDLAAVVRQAIEISRPLIDARKHRLEVSLPKQIMAVEGDPVRLAQVVSNLLNNAAKYTKHGGRIDLAVEENAGEALIRVRDTGLGIAPAMLPHIFEIFTQVQASMSLSEGGLGIGLSLVESLVKLHGGSVQAFSGGIGQGSEFIVRLPLLQEAFRLTLPTEPRREKRCTPSRNILVVDDNKDAAESLAVLLRLGGHDVRVAHSGTAALDAAQERAPDMVLLDIGLPNMDGLEVARRLRQDLGLTNILLAALTGYGQEDMRSRTQEAGFNAHLVKPVDLDALQGLLAHPELLMDSQATT